MNKQQGFAQRGSIRAAAAAVLLGFILLSGGAALAQSSLPAMPWWAVGSGGGPQSAANVVLDGTLGLPVVGESSAEGIAVGAGYWNASTESTASAQPLFLPFVQR